MKVGLISDTHGHLEASVFEHFNDCDEIWHAGDIGSQELLDTLKAFKPVRSVFGNIDSILLQRTLPEDDWFICEGLRIWMTHIGGAPPNYNPRIKKKLKESIPDIFICGHSHILRVMRDPKYNNMLYINPGAAGNHGFHRMKTIIRFTLEQGQIKDVNVIELGKRGALPNEV